MDHPTINASQSILSPAMFRAARDKFGEDAIPHGHPAQQSLWEMAKVLLVSGLGYPQDELVRMRNWWLGPEFIRDASLSDTVILFKRGDETVGEIRNLAKTVYY